MIGAEGVCGKRVLAIGFLSLSSCLRKNVYDGPRHGGMGAEGVCGKRVLPVGFLSLSSCLRKTFMKKAVRKKNNKKQVCSDVESTNLC